MMRKVLMIAGALALAGCVVVEGGDDALPAPLPKLSQQQDTPQLALLDHALAAYFAENPRFTTCAAANDGRTPEALDPAGEAALMERHPRLAPFARCVMRDGLWFDEGGEGQEGGDLEATVVELANFTCTDEFSCTGWVRVNRGVAGMSSKRFGMEWGAGGWTIAPAPNLIAQ